MSLPINFDLRNLYVPNTSQIDYPDTYLDLETLRDALNNFAGVFSSAFSIDAAGNISTPTNSLTFTAEDSNIYLGGVPSTSLSAEGLRLHYAGSVNLAVIDCNYPIAFRNGAGQQWVRIEPDGRVGIATGVSTHVSASSVPHNTATNVFLVPSQGIWLVGVYIVGALPTFPGYFAYGVFCHDGGGVRPIYFQDTLLTLSMSGNTIQATQFSGITQTLVVRALKIF